MTASTTPTNTLAGKDSGGRWLLQNLGPEDIYVSRSEDDCTTADGIRVAANEAMTLDTPVRDYNGGNELWIVTDTGTSDVRLMRIG
jgi:hypothetical protein